VIDNAACPLCQTSSEDIKHMMLTCGRAKSVWNFLGIGSQIDRLAQGGRLGQQMIEEAIRSGGNVKRLNNVGLPELILIGDGIFGGKEEDLSMASLSRTLIGLLRRSLP